MKGKAVLFCGPSGSGKTTIVQYLLQHNPVLKFSVSATTRDRRQNETDGKDYYFLSVDDFKKKITEDAFLEWEEVYKNGFYGTLKSEIEKISNENKVVIFDVDVEGGLNIKSKFGNNLLDVMVVPPSIEDLKKRLVTRASETPESLKKRIDKAEHELTYTDKFRNVIVNKDLPDACSQAQQLLNDFLMQNNN